MVGNLDKKAKKDGPEEMMENFGGWASRNFQGEKLEKAGNIDAAIALYEQNLSEEADTPFSYRRLVILYKKRKDFQGAIRVLEAGINRGFKGPEFPEKLAKLKAKVLKD